MSPLPQVLVWKTNFDSVDHKEVLTSRVKKSALKKAHTHDPPPSTSHTHNGTSHPLELDATRAPTDHMTPPPHVVNVGPQMFHKPHPQETTPLLVNGENGVGGAKVSQTTPLEQMTMSPQLTNTLEHIVGQLDILTQVSSHPLHTHTHSHVHTLTDCFYTGGAANNDREQT